jgi:ATP-dependent RNA helicase DDX35
MAELNLGTTFIPALHKPAALLPIAKHRDALLYTIETYPVTIVVGQTGSGKSTQIPQYLEQAGWCANGKTIGITQVSLGSSGLSTFTDGDNSLAEWPQPRSP